jgi:hypothetical protein
MYGYTGTLRAYSQVKLKNRQVASPELRTWRVCTGTPVVWYAMRKQ